MICFQIFKTIFDTHFGQQKKTSRTSCDLLSDFLKRSLIHTTANPNLHIDMLHTQKRIAEILYKRAKHNCNYVRASQLIDERYRISSVIIDAHSALAKKAITSPQINITEIIIEILEIAKAFSLIKR